MTGNTDLRVRIASIIFLGGEDVNRDISRQVLR